MDSASHQPINNKKKPADSEVTMTITTKSLKTMLFNATVNFLLFRLQGTIFGGAVRDHFLSNREVNDIDLYVGSLNRSINRLKDKFGNGMVHVEVSENNYGDPSAGSPVKIRTAKVTVTLLAMFPEMKQLMMPSLSIDLVEHGSSKSMIHDFDVNMFSISLKRTINYEYPDYVKGEFHPEPLWEGKVRTQYFGDPNTMLVALDNITQKRFSHLKDCLKYPIPNNGESYKKRARMFRHIANVARRTIKKIDEGWTTQISDCPLLHNNTEKRSCSICNEIFQYDLLLPCGHAVCCDCLIGHVDGKVQFGEEESCNQPNIQCPVCRYELIDTDSSVVPCRSGDSELTLQQTQGPVVTRPSSSGRGRGGRINHRQQEWRGDRYGQPPSEYMLSDESLGFVEDDFPL